MLQPKLRKHRGHESHVGLHRIIIRRMGPGQAESRKIESDHAALAAQAGGPAVPGMQAVGRAMQQDDGRRIIPWAFVAQMHLQTVDRHEL
jgi:hypothetical protein